MTAPTERVVETPGTEGPGAGPAHRGAVEVRAFAVEGHSRRGLPVRRLSRTALV